ncbi:MAG: PQQ-binding-like beta-propeller repeat protein, partial [Thermoplasmatota archaeon]
MMNLKYLAVATLLILLCISSFNLYGGGEPTTDGTPPVTTLEYDGPTYEDESGDTWISNQTLIWLNATDDQSGVQTLTYILRHDANHDGEIDTETANVTVNDNMEGDENDQFGIISVAINFSEECLHSISYYSVDYEGNIERYDDLYAEWYYQFKTKVMHEVDNVTFGSSPAIADLIGDANLEIFTGSDEQENYYGPDIGQARGIWRCFNAYGTVLYSLATQTDESRSSPAIYDIDNDGNKEVVGGTTSGWYLEVMEGDQFEWAFPATSTMPVPGGNYVWHSSPALVDVDSSISGVEVIIGNNPYNSVWCFDGDNSDQVNDGIKVLKFRDFPGFPKALGSEGIDWDVLWIFNTAGHVVATPAIGDIDNDGTYEAVVGDLAGNLYIINAKTGTEEWRFTTGNGIWSSAALADVDGDGLMEIFVGSNDSRLYCLEWDGTTGEEVWNYTTGGPVFSSPSVGDIDGDLSYEIVVGSTDGNLYCFSSSGTLKWTVTTGGPIFSSPALAELDGTPHAQEWPCFRGNRFRNGFYPGTGKNLEIYIGSDDHILYDIDGEGNILHTFTSRGRIHTSPSVADVDGDGNINIVFYDWGGETGDGTRDTFWCLERVYANTRRFRIDICPPHTEKTVVSRDTYYIRPETAIWLNATDDFCICNSGVSTLHYEIWHDTDGDSHVDDMIESGTIIDNTVGDYNPADGLISTLIHLTMGGTNELRWYAMDNVAHTEQVHYQEHYVVTGDPELWVVKGGPVDPV